MLKINHPLDVESRLITVDDLDQIVKIEEKAHSHPWNLSHFASSLSSRHHCHLLEVDEEIVAYAVTSTAYDEAELLNLTVAPDHQRQGIGRSLLNALSESFDKTIKTFFLEVRESNSNAIDLYIDEGFNEVGRRPGYYPGDDKREDAIIMAKTLRMDSSRSFLSFFKK